MGGGLGAGVREGLGAGVEEGLGVEVGARVGVGGELDEGIVVRAAVLDKSVVVDEPS